MAIPKILHYCWFGENSFPKTEAKCFETWKRQLGEFELKKWDETNFDTSVNLYVKQAYEEKKYAYVSDYARLKALYEEGGLYLDTDCKVLKSFSPLLQMENNLGFTGFGGDNKEIAAHAICVPKGHPFIKECLDSYEGQPFRREDGSLDTTSINVRMMNILMGHGFVPNGKQQTVYDMVIYPMTYFCPLSFLPDTVPDCKSKNTYCIHIWSDIGLKRERSFLVRFAHKTGLNKLKRKVLKR